MNANPQLTARTATELSTPRDTPPVCTPGERLHASVADAQLSVALTWLSRGYPVVPCSRTDKGAMVPGFGKDKTAEQLAPFRNPETIRAWWRGRFKRAHVGLLTGRGADGRGLVVIDLDMRKPDSVLPDEYTAVASGVDVLERLATAAGQDWPDTYTVLTPGGGVHLYYQQPEDGPLIGCATGDKPTAPHLGPLIDVRGIGGYVIAAGSYSAEQGLPYRRASLPGTLPGPLPGWLLDRMRPAVTESPRPRAAHVLHLPDGSRAERAAAGALEHSVRRIEDAHEGERNRAVFAAARWLGELHSTAPSVLSETAVQEQLLAAARSAGQSERESLRTIRSGWERGLRGGAMGGAA